MATGLRTFYELFIQSLRPGLSNVGTLVWLWERSTASFGAAGKASATAVTSRLAPFLAASALALRVAFVMPLSPHITNLWILTKATPGFVALWRHPTIKNSTVLQNTARDKERQRPLTITDVADYSTHPSIWE